MVKTSEAQTAREKARARIAQRSAEAKRKEEEVARAAEEKRKAAAAVREANDRANEKSLTAFYRAADKITAARAAQGQEVAAVREREGSVRAAAELLGISESEAKTLIALAAETDTMAGSEDTTAVSDTGTATSAATDDAEVVAKAS